MSSPKKKEAHLLAAAIRVLENRQQRPPTPEEMAELLDLSESAVRLQLNALSDLGIFHLVESAFAVHVEIKDYLLIEDLSDTAGPAISEDLAAFDRKKEAEARRMANLFDSGEHEATRKDRLDKMDQELKEFKGKKPLNPFGDD